MQSLAGWSSAAIYTGVCLCAFGFGRTPERVAAIAMEAATVATVLVQDRVAWIDPQRRLLAIDGSLLIVFVGLVFTTRRRWIIPATALQLLLTALHFMVIYKAGLDPVAYLDLDALLSYGVLASLAWGTWTVARGSKPRQG